MPETVTQGYVYVTFSNDPGTSWTPIGDLFTRLRILTPAGAPWRSDAALAHLALGAQAEAKALAAEELTLAQAYNGPRTLGIAVRAAGLRRAERVASSCRTKQSACSRTPALGWNTPAPGLTSGRPSAEPDSRRRPTEGRDILRHALDLAHRHGAFALTERTRTELVAAGGQPRRLVLRGLDALTSSERRAAQLAAVGLSNREIAQNLFVTTRTVEGHLTHTYQKLAITSREQLPAALAPRTAGLPPCSGIALSASPSPSTTTALMADGAD